jgi:hypothetical protein
VPTPVNHQPVDSSRRLCTLPGRAEPVGDTAGAMCKRLLGVLAVVFSLTPLSLNPHKAGRLGLRGSVQPVLSLMLAHDG